MSEKKIEVPMVQNKQYMLGVMGTEKFNEKTGQTEYAVLLVDQSILNWLNQHDVRYDDRRRKIFVVNRVQYLFLGEAKPQEVQAVEEVVEEVATEEVVEEAKKEGTGKK